MNGKTLRLPLFFSLLILLVPLLSARADDQVTIKIQMEGDAYVEISNNNGTIVFNYNGKNIMPKIKNDVNWLKARANSNKLAIYLLRRDLHRLVKVLNDTFGDLYGKVYFLAHVTGIYNGNDNSSVTLRLKSGNMTLTDFIDQLLNTTEKQDIQIRNIKMEISSNRHETQQKLNDAFNQILTNRAYFESQLSQMDAKINTLADMTNSTFARVFNDLELLKMYEEINVRSTQIAIICIGILNLFMLGLIVWIASWKAKQT